MFQFTREPSSGSYNQYLAKNYHALCEGILYTVHRHTVHGTHASQVTICSHNTDKVL